MLQLQTSSTNKHHRHLTTKTLSSKLFVFAVLTLLCILISLPQPMTCHGDETAGDNYVGARPTKSLEHVITNRVNPTSTKPQRLLVVSLDGFRHDFMEIHSAPILQKLANDGVKAKSMTASYVTKTFPNHHTIATGLYEESHGIIANRMYDPVLNKSFNHCSTPDCGNWYGGEPIWNSNELNNREEARKRSRLRRHASSHTLSPLVRRSGAVYWPGASASINSMNVTYSIPYSGPSDEDYMTLRQRFDKIVEWFTDDSNPINLGVVYSESPDRECHKYGPESLEVGSVL